MVMTGIKERPILFSGPMVKAILEGRKTQTRRVVKPQPVNQKSAFGNLGELWHYYDKQESFTTGMFKHWMPERCPYGQPGDRLWLREALYTDSEGAYYKADDMSIDEDLLEKNSNWIGNHWRDGNQSIPSIHMPRWASRINLEITNVRVERVQEISEQDAKTEGCIDDFWPASVQFSELWTKINGKKYLWKSNPWVWVIVFKPAQSARF